MITLGAETVEEWLGDCRKFSYEFLHCSATWHQAIGLFIEFHDELVEQAHSEWVRIVNEWKRDRFEQGAEYLSYTKTFAILLFVLSQKEYCVAIHEYEAVNKDAPQFNGSDDLKRELRQDVLGSPEVVTALEFCLMVLNFYESRRIDRKTPFAFRMTESSRHDLIAAIARREMSAEAIFLALENLYARH